MDFPELLRMFHPISDESIEKIRPFVSLRKVAAKEKIIVEGEVADSVYLVKSGAFRNYSVFEEKEHTRWFAIEGDLFTSMFSFSKGEPAIASVIALIDSEVYCAPISEVKKIIVEDKGWAVWSSQYCIDGLYQLSRKYVFLGRGDAYTRYVNLMKYKTFQLLNNVPLQVIASYLDVAPQTLSRIRRRIAKER